jgi:uncharacterized protein (DUF1810 family)
MRSDRFEDLKLKLKQLIQELSFETQDVDEDSHHHLNAQQKGISAGDTQNARKIDRDGIPLRDGLNELVDEYKKTKDWIWYGFPTLYYEKGSATNKAFALTDHQQFQAYLQTPALLQNLLVTLSCLSYAIQNNSVGPKNVLGQDYQKAQNSIKALSKAAADLSELGNSQYDGFYIQLQKALANFQNALTDQSKAAPESFIILHQESQKIFASRLGSPVDPGGLRSNAGSSVSLGGFSDEELAKAIAASLADSPEREIRKQVQFYDEELILKLDDLVSYSVKEPHNFMILPAIKKSDSYVKNPFEPGFLSVDGNGLNNFTKIISSLDALELNQKFRTIMPLQIDEGHWNSLVIDFAKKNRDSYKIEATQIDPKGTPKKLQDVLKTQLETLVEGQLSSWKYEVVANESYSSPAFQKPGDIIKCGPYVVATIASLWPKEVRHIPVHDLVALKQAKIELIAQPMIKAQNTELARRLANARILEEKHEYKLADTDPQSRVYNQTKLYNFDNDPKASVRIKDELVREHKAAAKEVGSGAAGINNWQHQEILNKIAGNLTAAEQTIKLPPGVNPAEFIRATIIFAQKYDGVGNAKDQTTGVRGEVLWRQNFGGTNLEYLFPLAKQFSYEYQTATKSSGVFTGRTENLKDTDSPIGARLKRIPEESVEGVIQMFQQKYVSHGI